MPRQWSCSSAEVDLSVGAVALIGGVIAFKLVQQPGPDWPWWAAVLAALAICGAIGAFQGALVSLLRIPSFVVTLAGFLLFSGILVVILGGADSTVSLNTSVPNQNIIYDMVQGLIAPVVGWIILAVVVVAAGTSQWLRSAARRRRGLVTPPLGLIAIRIALMAIVGAAVVIICSVNRGSSLKSVTGIPWVIPIVLVVLGAWTLVLQRTRFGRYIYAIGGNPEAARRAGVSLPAIRIWAFALCSATAALGGILLGSFFYGRVQQQYGRPRPARPVHGRRRGYRRGQPLRRPGQGNSRCSRRPPHRRYRLRRVPSQPGLTVHAVAIHPAGRRAPRRGAD